MKTLAQFSRFNNAMIVAGVGATFFQGTAIHLLPSELFTKMKNIVLRILAALLGTFIILAGIWMFFVPVHGTLMEKGSCIAAIMFGVIFIRFSICRP